MKVVWEADEIARIGLWLDTQNLAMFFPRLGTASLFEDNIQIEQVHNDECFAFESGADAVAWLREQGIDSPIDIHVRHGHELMRELRDRLSEGLLPDDQDR